MGGNIPSPRRLEAFQDMLSSCGLVDLEFKGPRFTWRNNRAGGELIMERIDMAFANAKWREVHYQAMVLVEAAIGSDHNPLILNTSSPLFKVGKPFHFVSFWTTEESSKPITMEAWAQQYAGTEMERICMKLRGCKEKLKLWHRQHFGDLRLQIAILKDQLADIQKKLDLGFDSEAIASDKRLNRNRRIDFQLIFNMDCPKTLWTCAIGLCKTFFTK